jgi:hypothetical protein
MANHVQVTAPTRRRLLSAEKIARAYAQGYLTMTELREFRMLLREQRMSAMISSSKMSEEQAEKFLMDDEGIDNDVTANGSSN